MRKSNILDPIQDELDQRVFRGTEPRPHVVNFIKRLYARAFAHEFGVPLEAVPSYVELVLTGSLTTYQYSDTSDCDISVFPDWNAFKELGLDPAETRRDLVAMNIDKLDGTFLPGGSHPLQFFTVAENVTPEIQFQPGLRSGYNLDTREWVVPPEKERSHDIALEYPDIYQRASEIAEKMSLMLDTDQPELAKELWKQVHKKRQLDQRAGLGDFCEGNIVYKWLVRQGLVDRLRKELHLQIATHVATYDDFEEFKKYRIPFYLLPDGTYDLGKPGQEHWQIPERRWLMNKLRTMPDYGSEGEYQGFVAFHPEEGEISSWPVDFETLQEPTWITNEMKEKVLQNARGIWNAYHSSVKKARTTLYHATYAAPRDIKQYGIDWRRDKRDTDADDAYGHLPRGNYLWETPEQAKKWGGDVYAVDVTGLHLQADPYFDDLPDDDIDRIFWQAPHGAPGAFYTLDTIPADRIVDGPMKSKVAYTPDRTRDGRFIVYRGISLTRNQGVQLMRDPMSVAEFLHEQGHVHWTTSYRVAEQIATRNGFPGLIIEGLVDESDILTYASDPDAFMDLVHNKGVFIPGTQLGDQEREVPIRPGATIEIVTLYFDHDDELKELALPYREIIATAAWTLGEPEGWTPQMPSQAEENFLRIMECPECGHHMFREGNYVWCPDCGWSMEARTAAAKMKIIYDFEKDRIILGSEAAAGQTVVIGEYDEDDKAATLFEAEKNWINPTYFRRLWNYSYPHRPLKEVHFQRGKNKRKLKTRDHPHHERHINTSGWQREFA